MARRLSLLILTLVAHVVMADSLVVPPAAAGISAELDVICPGCARLGNTSTGVSILEQGEDALMSRAWLTQHAAHSIDVQYFIWSTDNIGILASEALLQAAERGIKVRVLVDDLLIDAENKTLLLLDRHPNVEIRIYNPRNVVGVSLWQRLLNAILHFRLVNQRMHDKTAIFDGAIGITGGRNMADEYFDYDHFYNFRDRDVLLVGKAVRQMEENFEEFWNSAYAVPVTTQLSALESQVTDDAARQHWQTLHDYARDDSNFEPQVRQALAGFHEFFSAMMPRLVWADVHFLSDKPGKNDNDYALDGGSEVTRELATQLRQARKSVVIESPYLVLSDDALALFAELVHRGVKVSVVTNSLASTDNLMAYSGYHNQRDELLKAGIEIHEFRAHPAIQAELVKRYERLRSNNPVFALHAKSMVIDGETAFVGTFNLDPRSMNLNTEVGMLVKNATVATELKGYIERDMLPANSWQVMLDENPDGEVEWQKRIKLWLYKLVPMQAVL